MQSSILAPGANITPVISLTGFGSLRLLICCLSLRKPPCAGRGIARVGGTGGHTSGDLFIAFATGNHLPSGTGADHDPSGTSTFTVRTVGDVVIDRLFDGVIEATEEAIVNALVAAPTVVGRDGIAAHALPHDRLREVLRAAGR